MSNHEKTIIYLTGFVILSLMIFVFYVSKLHSLAIEGNTIFEYRCLHVNPPLIGYKNSFLKYADFMNTYPNTKYTPEQVQGFIDGYISGMRAYVPEETKWLDVQKKFIDRWDYQLIEPWYIKEGGVYQWKMYEGYRDDASSLLRTFDHPETAPKDLKPGDVTEEKQRRDTYSQKYFDHYEKAVQIRDWRKFFGTVPIPKGCTEENIMIPNTSGSIDWERDPNSATPSSVPIDPYGVS